MAVTLPYTAPSEIDAALRLDFRSDTITQPTPAMRDAMSTAKVGDDVFGEDPSINALEAEAARIFDKQAGVFVASGTQGNLLALLSLTRPGDELIAEVSSHIANSEVGGAARLGGLTLRPVVGRTTRTPGCSQSRTATTLPAERWSRPKRLTRWLRPRMNAVSKCTLTALEFSTPRSLLVCPRRGWRVTPTH